jgi:hypothetical protein
MTERWPKEVCRDLVEKLGGGSAVCTCNVCGNRINGWPPKAGDEDAVLVDGSMHHEACVGQPPAPPPPPPQGRML